MGPGPGSALSRCVGDVEEFLAGHWTRRPLHRAGACPAAFADLFSLGSVDQLVSAFPRLPAFRLVRDGKPLDRATYTRSARLGGSTVTGVGDTARICEEFAAGATIVLQGLHRYWPPLMQFCRDLELELTHPVQTNAYVTPPGSRGLAVHHDTHDVLVLQISGSKRWAVHEPVLEDPLPSQRWSSDLGWPGPPVLEVELRPGDCMYIPRGFPHSAEAQQEATTHLTIGILTRTWTDVVKDILGRVEEEVDFRRSLPAGFAADPDGFAGEVEAHLGRLREWLGRLDPGEIAGDVADRFWTTRWPVLTGQLSQMMALDDITDTSVLRRRPGSICRLETVPGEDGTGRRLRVVLGDRELLMPGALEPVMETMAAAGHFSLRDLGDHLDEPSRLVLARRLVREGLLEVVDG